MCDWLLLSSLLSLPPYSPKSIIKSTAEVL